MRMTRLPFLLLLLTMSWLPSLHAQQDVSLLDAGSPEKGWNFNNGQEFKGAKGGLVADVGTLYEGRPTLKLTGDFTNGGRYVEAGRKFPKVDIKHLTLAVLSPGTERFTLRLIDATGQVHQIAIETNPGNNWQRLELPLEDFFAKRGSADAVPGIVKYESWGGAKDGKWHGGATAMYLLLGRVGEEKISRDLWLGKVSITPPAQAVAGLKQKVTVPLDDVSEGESEWRFTNGPEFKGATGSLKALPVEEGSTGISALQLSADFSQGGAYVAMVRDLQGLNLQHLKSIKLRIKSSNTDHIGVQLVDGSGQTHQKSRIKINPNGEWQEIVLDPLKIAGGEHWGGANDGKWKNPARLVSLSLPAQGTPHEKKLSVAFSQIKAEIEEPVFIQPPAFKENFESNLTWKAVGKAALTNTSVHEGQQALQLSRTENENVADCSATSPAFAVTSGLWEVQYAARAALKSPDNSYHAALRLEGLDASGKVVEQFPLGEVYGTQEWKVISKRVEIPASVASARFQVQLNKTWGEFWLDGLSASCLAPLPRKDERVTRILFSSPQLGNLLFPEDKRTFGLTIEARKPLLDNQKQVVCVVRDYWGAEQTELAALKLGAPKKEEGKFTYEATLDLSQAELETGRYYEIHAEIPQDGGAFRNHTSFAILPQAITKNYKPAEIPFTSRSWDNRVPESIRLTDRLGVRICGLWGGWSSKPPYTAEAPRLDLVKELGMGWLTTTPIKFIEQGKRELNETELREGVRNLIKEFGDHRPFIINLGNEPHGTGERVRTNVAAYKIVYEEVKKVDPSILVVATSVEPNEEYFKLGYGKYCDAFDFHIYEAPANVRNTMSKYRELMKKYDVEKPLWSTELGLNSQGMTRLVVAREVTRKFATFFAAGGQNMCWFSILYPDPDGKSHGSFGDSHNVFDSRFKRYAPRLDAIAYYHGVNAIADKKVVTEKLYEGDIRSVLFRDKKNQSLQILWKSEGRVDVHVPLSDAGKVKVIRVDGSSFELNAAPQKGVTLTVNEDPLLLLYTGTDTLPEALGKPLATWVEPPPSVLRAQATDLQFKLSVTGVRVDVLPPNKWEAVLQPTSSIHFSIPLKFAVKPPRGESRIREVELAAPVMYGEETVGRLFHRAKAE